jgi:hypothetical protein
MKHVGVATFLAISALLGPRPLEAADAPAFAKVMVAKDTKLLKIVIKPPPTYPLPAGGVAGEDPTLSDVSDLSVFVYNGSGGALGDGLTAGTWDVLGSDPMNPLGYKYLHRDAPSGGPVKVVLIKPSVIKVLAKDDGSLLPGPIGAADVGLRLVVGSTNYCAGSESGSEMVNTATKWRYKDNAVSGVCPLPGGTTSTTTATTSTTSTTAGGPCCNGAGFYSFKTIDGPGDCGDIATITGASIDLQCSGLYVGGGGNSAALPIAVPDQANMISSIVSCEGQTALLGPTTSSQTGSNRWCTDTGCLFGPPLAVPNALSTPTSLCLVGSFLNPLVGQLDCGTGLANIAAPVRMDVFVTGDLSPDAGIQPCPRCVFGTCDSGPSNGMACVPATSTLGGDPAYPTSHDCPPDPMLSAGTLPIGFTFTTGSITWTGTEATNDTEVELNQPRVFSGYCRDADGTAIFQSPAQHCWENGMAVVLIPCAGVYETCEQRTIGAFGPNGGATSTITAIGTSSSLLGGPVPTTLVNIFSIAPSFNATVDATYDLPGPGAIALPGTARLCATANPCP